MKHRHEMSPSPIGSSISRRSFGKIAGQISAWAGTTALAPVKSWAAAGKFAGTKLVYVGWGGIYQESQKEAFCEPFAKETGATVIQDGPVDIAKIRLMVAGGRPTWDVVDVEGSFMDSGAKENLFEKIDTSIVDTAALDRRFVNEYGVGDIVWSWVLGYSKTAYTDTTRPRSWTDLFDVVKFPGQRMINDSVSPALEVALLADGVPGDKLYPLDVDRAFRKLDTIREHTIFWTTNSQSQQLLADGEVTMGVLTHGRLFDLVRKGAKLGVEWNQELLSADYLVVLRGSHNVPASMALINEMTKPEAQAKVSDVMATAPTNPKALDLIDSEAKPWIPTSPSNSATAVVTNESYWRDNLRPLTERWMRWKLG